MKWSEKADHKPKEIGITLMVTLLVYGHLACLSGPHFSVITLLVYDVLPPLLGAAKARLGASSSRRRQ